MVSISHLVKFVLFYKFFFQSTENKNLLNVIKDLRYRSRGQYLYLTRFAHKTTTFIDICTQLIISYFGLKKN